MSPFDVLVHVYCECRTRELRSQKFEARLWMPTVGVFEVYFHRTVRTALG